MALSLITAMDDNRVIGINNTLPWHIPEDLQHFKNTTKGHTVIMGRKTYDSLGVYKPLPNRVNIVISRTQYQDNEHQDVHFTSSLENAINLAPFLSHSADTFIIGGSEIYTQALPLVECMYITHVIGTHCGNKFFPHFDLADWDTTTIGSGEKYNILKYTRKQ